VKCAPTQPAPTMAGFVRPGVRMTDPRSSYAWQQLSKQVVREEPYCWLKLAGCTGLSTTGDHILTVAERPDLALVRSNVRGACSSCNNKRNRKTIAQVAAMRGQAEALGFFAE
jgi:5-methylcytosine-specific restriction endonuclease McrA